MLEYQEENQEQKNDRREMNTIKYLSKYFQFNSNGKKKQGNNEFKSKTNQQKKYTINISINIQFEGKLSKTVSIHPQQYSKINKKYPKQHTNFPIFSQSKQSSSESNQHKEPIIDCMITSITIIWSYYKQQQMRKQLSEKLQATCNTELAVSMVFEQKICDNSIICQLGDLIDDEEVQNIRIARQPSLHQLLSQQQSNIGKIKYPPRLKKDGKVHLICNEEEIQNSDYRKGKNRIGMINNDEKYQYPVSRYEAKQKILMNEKRKLYRELPIGKFSHENTSNFKIKFEVNKSGVVRNKELIYRLLDRCQICGAIKSDVLGHQFVCSNRNCRNLLMVCNPLTFPVVGLLFEGEVPSSSNDQLEDFVRKIKGEIQKVQEWLKSLIQLSNEIETIMQNRKLYQKTTKNAIKQLLSLVPNQKLRKVRESEDMDKIGKMLKKIPIGQLYQQFKQWSNIDSEKLQRNKSIYELVEKYKPMCLKVFNNQLAEEMENISDNFRGGPLYVRVSEYMGYNFVGNLNQIVLRIDSSIQVKRENFRLIEKLERLKLNFECRKTSRQLRQLFNILPRPRSLVINFDYKFHSHLSSESFPLISKASQLSQQQLQLVINNARPQILDDLMQASKTMTAKSRVKIILSINSHVEQNQWPTNMRSKQWGTKIVKNMLRGVGAKISRLELVLPIYVNFSEICEYVLRGEYPMLINFSIKTMNQDEIRQNNLYKLLNKVINRRIGLLQLLVQQKKQGDHILNTKYKLAQSVYHVLF